MSNHGACGHSVFAVIVDESQIDALGEVVAAVAGRCDVFLDGGVRSGTDVFKAIALGAKAVFIGRPAIYGLTYDVGATDYLRLDV